MVHSRKAQKLELGLALTLSRYTSLHNNRDNIVYLILLLSIRVREYYSNLYHELQPFNTFFICCKLQGRMRANPKERFGMGCSWLFACVLPTLKLAVQMPYQILCNGTIVEKSRS